MTPTSNPLMSRFDGMPCFIEPKFESRVQTALNAVIGHERSGELLAAQADSGTFWYPADDWRACYRPYVVSGGILQVPVKGVLLHNFPWALDDYATGYNYIWQAILRGLDDPEVKGIALVIDSPGGQVAGCFDLVDKATSRRGEKPIRAFAHEGAYSAAYAIATIADRIDVSKTGGVGSIGVVTFHTDYSVMMEQQGIKRTYIYAGKHKVDGNPTEPLSQDVQDRWQDSINELYQVFVSTVARNRGLSEEVVRATEAATFTATQAIENHLADAIGSLDDQLAAFAVDMSNSGENPMSTTTDTSAANQAAVDAARAEGATQGATAGASAERHRISAIKALDEAKERPAAAETVAMDTAMSVDDAKAFLTKLPKETAASATVTSVVAEAGAGNRFEAAMNGTKNPEISADGGATEEVSDSARILASYFGAPAKF